MKPKPYEYQPDYDTYHWEGYPQPPDRVSRITIACTITLIVAAALALFCNGCVTAPNSNLAITIDLLSSHSRYGQALGGTNTTIRGQIEGGGGNGAHASMTP